MCISRAVSCYSALLVEAQRPDGSSAARQWRQSLFWRDRALPQCFLQAALCAYRPEGRERGGAERDRFVRRARARCGMDLHRRRYRVWRAPGVGDDLVDARDILDGDVLPQHEIGHRADGQRRVRCRDRTRGEPAMQPAVCTRSRADPANGAARHGALFQTTSPFSHVSPVGISVPAI